MINAIPDGHLLDIDINGNRVIENFSFGQVYPAPATPARYVSVDSGTTSVQAFPPAETTNPVSPTGPATFGGATEYTVVAAGLELNDYPPVVLTDDNTPPSAGNVELRIINASPQLAPARRGRLYRSPRRGHRKLPGANLRP